MKTMCCGGGRDGSRKMAPQATENARFMPENGMGSERFDRSGTRGAGWSRRGPFVIMAEGTDRKPMQAAAK